VSGPVELTVVSGSPTPEELCAVLVALRLATAAGGGADRPVRPRSVRPTGPWPVPRSAPQVSPVSWAG
jgi:hypothetical protein